MMRYGFFRYGLLSLTMLDSFGAAAEAQNVPGPAFQVGDGWVFDRTVEKGSSGYGSTRLDMVVERIDDGTMVVGLKRDGAPSGFEDHVVGLDWSKRRLVDGEQTITTRPLRFPLHVGQSWTVDFDDETRRGAQEASHVHRTYTVTGWEDVTVPAGTFRAVKIEAKGADTAVVDVPNTAASGVVAGGGGAVGVSRVQRGGRRRIAVGTYAAFYYVPALKYWAKSVEEQYNTDGVRVVRTTESLVSFKPGP